ncbi:MAG: radical SAM protein [Phycisphaerae bacterium]|nr:radical SAM protein [Phycisphaerae bacterium]
MSKLVFRELTTAFLREKLAELESRFGRDSEQYLALARQYVRTPEEDVPTEEANLRHYEADIATTESGPHTHPHLPGVERLYRRTLVIEPTLACAAHCRFCIRANYPRHNLSEPELREIARYCGSEGVRDEVTEVLVTGGDPLLVPHRVEYLMRALIEFAPNIRIARIATRIPVQDPAFITEDVLRLFEDKPSLRLELATQINHRVELFPEVVDVFRQITDRNVTVYAQNVLLRGVNDDLDALVGLYDAMRQIGIEAHYLFHCVPLMGMGHLRTSLQRSIDLAKALTCSGNISGRAKPMLAAMTDIGKIVLYDGVVLERDGRYILLQSDYSLEDRRRWNPGWQIPETAEVDRRGRLRVWYLDGDEVAATMPNRRNWPKSRSDQAETHRALIGSAKAAKARVRRLPPVVQRCG